MQNKFSCPRFGGASLLCVAAQRYGCKPRRRSNLKPSPVGEGVTAIVFKAVTDEVSPAGFFNDSAFDCLLLLIRLAHFAKRMCHFATQNISAARACNPPSPTGEGLV